MRTFLPAAGLLLVVSVACLGEETPTPAPSTPAVAEPAPPPAPTPASAASPLDESGLADNPAAYDGQWLVIVSSKTETVPLPDGLEALAGSNGVEPARLRSGWYRNLSPCYEVIVAGAAPDRTAAAGILEVVKGAGIDGYIKPAGEFVGRDGRIEQMCAELAADADGGFCDGGVGIAMAMGAQWYLSPHVPDGVAERIVADAGTPRPLDDERTQWGAPIAAQTVGSVSVGDAYQVRDVATGELLGECTVASFAAITQGTPHFSYADGARDRPGCGSPEPWAVLDCPVESWRRFALAAPVDGWRGVWSQGPVMAPGADRDGIIAKAREIPAVKSAWEEAQRAARDEGVPLQESIQVVQMGDGDVDRVVVELLWTTGEGFAACGGEDVRISRTYAATAQGEPLGAVRDTAYSTWAGVVNLGDGAELVLEVFGGGIDVGDGACGVELPFCDCAC